MTTTRAKGRERYPHAAALLDRLLAAHGASPTSDAPTGAFSVGPAVLRAPPPVFRRAQEAARPRHLDQSLEGEGSTEEMLGELVDMVFVSADEAQGGNAEVHLVFKAEVLGGLHMKLVKLPDGMHATFMVDDAAARRAVSDNVDGLVAHLKERGFSIASHRIEIASGAAGAP
jgi:flagellar hook-length control protein FliK